MAARPMPSVIPQRGPLPG
jgi:hypothetical protein